MRKYVWQLNMRLVLLMRLLVTLFLVASIIGCTSIQKSVMASVPEHLKPFVANAYYTVDPYSLSPISSDVSIVLSNGVSLSVDWNDIYNSSSTANLSNQSAESLTISLVTRALTIIAPPPSTSCQP